MILNSLDGELVTAFEIPRARIMTTFAVVIATLNEQHIINPDAVKERCRISPCNSHSSPSEMPFAILQFGALTVVKPVHFRKIAGDNGGLLDVFAPAFGAGAAEIALVMAIVAEGMFPIDAAVDDPRSSDVLKERQHALGIEFGRAFRFKIKNGARIAQQMIRRLRVDFGFGVALE